MAQSRITREVDALCRSGRTHQREPVLPWVYAAAEAGAEAEAEAGALPSRLAARLADWKAQQSNFTLQRR